MTTEVIAYAVNQTHKFFSAFCPRRAHFSTQTFLSRAYEKASLRTREEDRVSVVVSHFLHLLASVFATRPFGIQNMCGRAISLIAHPLFTHRRPSSCRPACPEMTNVTCYGVYKGKLSSTTRHGNRVALAGHAVATREEKSGRFISQKGARQDLCLLLPTDALAVSPR